MPNEKSPVNAIPPTTEIRERLSETVRESKLLRSMLRLAEARDKAVERYQRPQSGQEVPPRRQ